MTTGVKVAIGIGIAVAVGGLIYWAISSKAESITSGGEEETNPLKGNTAFEREQARIRLLPTPSVKVKKPGAK